MYFDHYSVLTVTRVKILYTGIITGKMLPTILIFVALNLVARWILVFTYHQKQSQQKFLLSTGCLVRQLVALFCLWRKGFVAQLSFKPRMKERGKHWWMVIIEMMKLYVERRLWRRLIRIGLTNRVSKYVSVIVWCTLKFKQTDTMNEVDEYKNIKI